MTATTSTVCDASYAATRGVDLRRIHSNSAGCPEAGATKCLRLVVRASTEWHGVLDQGMPCWSTVDHADRGAPHRRGGRVRLIAAALKAAGLARGPGVRIPPPPLRRSA